MARPFGFGAMASVGVDTVPTEVMSKAFGDDRDGDVVLPFD